MGIFDHWSEEAYPTCSRCEGEDWLSPQEAEAALEDLTGLFIYLSIHGFTTPIPSVIRLVEHLKAKSASRTK